MYQTSLLVHVRVLTCRDTLTFLAASLASTVASCIDHVSMAGKVPSFFTCSNVGRGGVAMYGVWVARKTVLAGACHSRGMREC